MSNPDLPDSTVAVAVPVSEAFESLAALRAEHLQLLKRSREGAGTGGSASAVSNFLARVRATGAILDNPTDREAAQGILDYWTATLFTLSRNAASAASLPSTVPGADVGEANVQLANFDPRTLHQVAAAADTWLAGLSDSDKTTVRRLMLRLARLQPEGNRFDPVSTIRSSLYDIEDQAQLNRLLEGLASVGVVRLTPGEDPDLTRVSLRSADLTTVWTTLAGWLQERLRFRETVSAWHGAGRPETALTSGESLDEARLYIDRNSLERDYVDRSRKGEWRKNEWNRTLKWLFAALAVALTVATVIAFQGWHTAVDRAAGAKSDAFQSGEKARILKLDLERRRDKQWLLNCVYLIHSLASIGTLDEEDERRLAIWHWNGLATSYREDSEYVEYASKIGLDIRANMKEDRTAAETAGDRFRSLETARTLRERAAEFLRTQQDEQAKEVIDYTLASRKRLVYTMVLNVTNAIVETYRSKSFGDAKAYVSEFKALYWGEMGVHEDGPIESAMVDFRKKLDEIESKVGDSFLSSQEVLKGDDLKRFAGEAPWRLLDTVKNSPKGLAGYSRLVEELAKKKVPPQLAKDLAQRRDTLLKLLKGHLPTEASRERKSQPRY